MHNLVSHLLWVLRDPSNRMEDQYWVLCWHGWQRWWQGNQGLSTEPAWRGNSLKFPQERVKLKHNCDWRNAFFSSACWYPFFGTHFPPVKGHKKWTRKLCLLLCNISVWVTLGFLKNMNDNCTSKITNRGAGPEPWTMKTGQMIGKKALRVNSTQGIPTSSQGVGTSEYQIM